MDIPFPFSDDSDEECELIQLETADDGRLIERLEQRADELAWVSAQLERVEMRTSRENGGKEDEVGV